jgi:hypothetical protein
MKPEPSLSKRLNPNSTALSSAEGWESTDWRGFWWGDEAEGGMRAQGARWRASGEAGQGAQRRPAPLPDGVGGGAVGTARAVWPAAPRPSRPAAGAPTSQTRRPCAP